MNSKLYSDNKEEEEIHTSFLISAAQYASRISSRVLKCHLNILSYETLRMKHLARRRWLKKNDVCQYCHTQWKNGEFSVKVLPVSKKQTRMKKIWRNIEKNKPLVKIEKKLADARNIRNVLLVKCLVCTKEVKFKLRGSYIGMAAGRTKISVPTLSVKNMEKKMRKVKKNEMKMKKIMKNEMKMKGEEISNSYPRVSFDHVSGSSQGARKRNPNQMKSPCIGRNSSQNRTGNEDEIEITYERCSPEKKRKLDCIDSDQGKPAKKRKKKKTGKTARYGVGVLNMPSSTPYNTPGDGAVYNTPYGAACAMPYDMQYNTPYGIPYSVGYSTPYNNGTYVAPYTASCNTSYDQMYADYGDYSIVDYNPPGTEEKKKKKRRKKKGAAKNQNSQNNVSENDLFLNPFCDKLQEICALPKKRLNRWKKLVSEEENKPTTNFSSFKNFLDKLKVSHPCAMVGGTHWSKALPSDLLNKSYSRSMVCYDRETKLIHGLEIYNEHLSQSGRKSEPAIKGTASEMAAGGVSGSGSDGQFRHLMGRTQGMIRSGLLSVIEGSSDIFSGISSKLESALSMSVDSNSSHSEAEGVTPSKDSACDDSIPSNRELRASGPDPFEKLNYKIEAASSESGSSKGGYGPSTSLELSEPWRSGSEGSVSSLSADGQNEEADAKCFMESYVATLFRDCSSLSLEDKAMFGKHVQTEAGRIWFARLINCERTRFKCVSEPTFYSLVQHFAIVLFECADADHFSPAKTLMNMCFTFYHEVDVPGCEPFREYLAAYLKNQPIWQSLRFWNAAFFDALQCERLHRPVVTREEVRQNRLEAITDERQYQENITFGQLGTFTCNMHAFGLDKELCYEFLRKQCLIAALAPDQEKMLHENVERMYEQTEPWR